MRNKQFFFRLVTITMVVTLGMLFSACGDDDKDDVDNGKDSTSEIIGTWGLVRQDLKVPNEQGGTNQANIVYDYLNPSKEGELVISLTPTDRGAPYYTLRQYNYDFTEEHWVLFSTKDAFIGARSLSFIDSFDIPYEWSINSETLILNSEDLTTDSFIKYTFRRISREVKTTNTLNIIK